MNKTENGVEEGGDSDKLHIETTMVYDTYKSRADDL